MLRPERGLSFGFPFITSPRCVVQQTCTTGEMTGIRNLEQITFSATDLAIGRSPDYTVISIMACCFHDKSRKISSLLYCKIIQIYDDATSRDSLTKPLYLKKIFFENIYFNKNVVKYSKENFALYFFSKNIYFSIEKNNRGFFESYDFFK